MSCTYAQDFIYKGVAILDNDGNKCRLRNAKDVARVILAKACGWNSRNKEVMSELEKKGFFPPFDSLKLESHLLMDDFVESSVVVRKTFSLQAHNSVLEVFFSYENRLAQLSRLFLFWSLHVGIRSFANILLWDALCIVEDSLVFY